jgi:hypothetical protein
MDIKNLAAKHPGPTDAVQIPPAKLARTPVRAGTLAFDITGHVFINITVLCGQRKKVIKNNVILWQTTYVVPTTKKCHHCE